MCVSWYMWPNLWSKDTIVEYFCNCFIFCKWLTTVSGCTCNFWLLFIFFTFFSFRQGCYKEVPSSHEAIEKFKQQYCTLLPCIRKKIKLIWRMWNVCRVWVSMASVLKWKKKSGFSKLSLSENWKNMWCTLLTERTISLFFTRWMVMHGWEVIL